MSARRNWRARMALGAIVALGALGGGTALAAEPVDFQQGFETDTAGLIGFIMQVPSGTDGIASSAGAFHAIAEVGTFTLFAGYSDEFPADGYVTEADFYLDPAQPIGQGFDYSVASNGSDGAHQRDFIFHVGRVADGRLLVNADNNTYGETNQFILQTANGGDNHTVTEAGWYTLRHTFRNDAGVLAVDMALVDAAGTELWSITRSNAADTIGAGGEVGGNRYGWLVHEDYPGGVPLDEVSLTVVVGAPGVREDCFGGGFAAFGFPNQGQCVASVVAAERSGR